MLTFTQKDQELLLKSYHDFLVHLKSLFHELNGHSINTIMLFIQMMHDGKFSMGGTISFLNNYPFFPIPSSISEGIHIPYGIACCRHATWLCKDVLDLLGYSTSLFFVLEDGSWKRATPTTANHIVLLYSFQNQNSLIDPANHLLLQILNTGDLKSLEFSFFPDFSFEDENIKKMGLTLKKYYHLRELGVQSIYD